MSKHAITSVQLDRVLRALRYEQDRCSAMVTLWPHVIDRAGLYTPFQTLSAEEQRQVWESVGECGKVWGIGVGGCPPGLDRPRWQHIWPHHHNNTCQPSHAYNTTSIMMLMLMC